MPERFVTPSFVLRTVLRLWQTTPAGVFSLWLLSLISSSSAAGTIRVDAQGFADFRTIQEGIDAANSGDTVLVEPGTYFEDISFTGRQVALISVAGAAATIIDASNEDSAAVNLFRGEPVGTMLKGFTITGGGGTLAPGGSREGGGIYAPHSNVRIAQCVVTSCSARWGGGIAVGVGVNLVGALPTVHIEGTTVSSNVALANGGGIHISNAHTTLSHSTIEYNTSGFDGGGIEVHYSAGSVHVVGNVISNNLARDKGGGIRVGCTLGSLCGQATIEFNVISSNEARGEDFSETGGGGGIAVHSGFITISNNTIARNLSRSELACSGGGILLTEGATPNTTRILRNIIAFNHDCGIGCRLSATAFSESNVLWMNGLGDVGTPTSRCEGQTQGGILRIDPQFCSEGSDHDFSVSDSSPAMTTAGGPIGAVTTPGCLGVSVEVRSWGWIKSRLSSAIERKGQ